MRTIHHLPLIIALFSPFTSPDAAVRPASKVHQATVPAALSPVVMQPAIGCAPTNYSWDDDQSSAIYEAGVDETFGYTFLSDGTPVLPDCIRTFNKQPIIFPVLLVDFEDYNPATDPYSPNRPDAPRLSAYSQSTPAELENYLNGPTGPAAYFRDVSGGQFNLQFEVIGWLRSDAPGSYLRPRADYIKRNRHNDRYGCDAQAVTADALRDAMVLAGKDFRRYDSEQAQSLNSIGFLDGFALVYEGGDGLCNSTNASLAATGEKSRILRSNETNGTYYGRLDQLLDSNDPNSLLIAHQRLYYAPYVNIPELSNIQNSTGDIRLGLNSTYIWAHELGHLFLGFPDHYHPRHGSFMKTVLSGRGADEVVVGHPAAWEKWFYGHWFEPADLTTSGTYTLQANEIPDGSRYDASTYLYRIPLGDSPYHYLTIENRWLMREGNTGSRWLHENHEFNSGLLIMEHDRRESYMTENHLRRHVPARENVYNAPIHGFIAGDVFQRCFNGRCIRIAPVSNAGSNISFNLTLSTQPVDDRDIDGVADSDDVFPDNSAEWLDNDKDGQGNNADPDDDNDSVPDQSDAFPLDAAEALDTDKDGHGNNADLDDDNDSVPDLSDTFPLDAAEALDTDKDGQGNNADLDDDNDRVADTADAFPLDPSRSKLEPQTNGNTSDGAKSGGGGSSSVILLLGMLIATTVRRQRSM